MSSPFGLHDRRQHAKWQAALAYFSPSIQTITAQSNFTDADEGGGRRGRVPSVEEIARPTSTKAVVPGTKRARQKHESTQVGLANKRERPGVEVNNLLPNYKIPKDATPIAVPQSPPYDFRSEWEPAPAPPASRSLPSMGGPYNRARPFKPMNTLNEPSKMAGSVRSQGDIGGNHDNEHKKEASISHPRASRQLNTLSNIGKTVKAKSRGSDVDSANEYGFSDAPVEKRQKTNHGKTVADTVDLTSQTSQDDDSMADTTIGTTIGRVRDVIPKGAQVQVPRIVNTVRNGSVKRQQRHPFYMSFDGVLQGVHDATNISKARKQRNPSSINYGLGSKNTTPESFLYGMPNQGTRQRPLDLDNSEEVMMDDGGAKQSSPINESRSDKPALPLIDLGQGVDEAGEAYRKKLQQKQRASEPRPKQGSRQDIGNANRMLQSAVQKGRNGNTQTQSAQPAKQRRQIQQSPGPIDFDGSSGWHLQSSRLPDQYVGDESLRAQPQRRRAPERMQGVYNSPTRVEDSDDDDPLNGASTMESRSSRNTSPSKVPLSSLSTSRVVNGAINPPNQIRPRTRDSGFREARYSSPEQEKSPRGVEAAAPTETDQIRISIKEITCKIRTLHGKGLELVWDRSKGVFFVVELKQRMTFEEPATGQVKPITFGEAESNSAFWYNEESCKAVLKGSMTVVSQRLMAIEFFDSNGLFQCRECLCSLSKPKPDQKWAIKISVEKMERVYANQIRENHELQEHAQKSRIRQNKPPTELISHGALDAPQQLDVNEIQYEDDERADRPAKVRKRMQVDAVPSGFDPFQEGNYQEPRRSRKDDGETSWYFSDDRRRSTRQTKTVKAYPRTPSPPLKWTQINKPKPWGTHSLVYPAKGPRRVTVDFTDLERLDEGEFLNDNIVNFELRHIEEHMKPEHKQKVHFFNTFFYTALSTKGNKKAFNYEAVMRWTKNTDLFNIPYVVVPINADLHWFVAIICNLHNIQRKCTAFDDEAPEDDGQQRGNIVGSGASVDAFDEPLEKGDIQTDTNAKMGLSEVPAVADNENMFAFNEDGVVDDERDSLDYRPDKSHGKKSKKKHTTLPKYDLDSPVIICMDSFGLARSPETKVLKQYIDKEAVEKRGIDDVFSKLRGMTAKGLPQQPNFSDCGVYLCGYVAEFAKNPDSFAQKILQRELQSNEFVHFVPSAKRDEIRNKILHLQQEQAADRQAQKKAKAAAKRGQTTQTLTSTSSALAATARSSPARLPINEERPPSYERQTTTLQDADTEQTPKNISREADDEQDTEDLELVPPRPLGSSPIDAREVESSSDEMLEFAEDGPAAHDSYHHSDTVALGRDQSVTSHTSPLREPSYCSQYGPEQVIEDSTTDEQQTLEANWADEHRQASSKTDAQYSSTKQKKMSTVSEEGFDEDSLQADLEIPDLQGCNTPAKSEELEF